MHYRHDLGHVLRFCIPYKKESVNLGSATKTHNYCRQQNAVLCITVSQEIGIKYTQTEREREFNA